MSTIMNLLSQQTIQRLGWTLVHFVWQAAAVALLLAALLYLLRRASSNARYIVSCLALVLIVALPLVTMQFVEVSGPLAEVSPSPTPLAVETQNLASLQVVEVVELPPASFEGPLPEAREFAVRVPWGQRVAGTLEPALPYLVLGWLLGVFGLSAWHLGGWAQLQRLKRRMVQKVAAPLQDKSSRLAERLGVKRAVTLLESALVEVPTVVGWIKPVVLLPASVLTGLSAEQLEAILAHELAHVKRYDYLVNILQTVVDILGFYHPAVWWISHRIRDERENCCDDLAVHVCGDSVRYAKALTHLEEMRHRGAELAMAATGGSLAGRVGRLIGLPDPARSRFAWLPGLVALLLVAGVVIPAALVLAAPTSNVLPPSELTEPENAGTPNEPEQILIRCMVVEVPSDATLDADAASQAKAILAGTGDPAGAAASVGDFQKPLLELVTQYATKPALKGDAAQAFADLLIAQEGARILSAPIILTQPGQPAQLVVGGHPGPDFALVPDEPNGFRVNMKVTPTIEDVNTILMSFELRAANFTAFTNSDMLSAGAVAIHGQLSLRSSEYALYCLPLGADRGTGSTTLSPETFLLLQVQSTIVAADEPPLQAVAKDRTESQVFHSQDAGIIPEDSSDDIVVMGAIPCTQVLLSFQIVDIATDRVLDPQTAAVVQGLLARLPASTAELPVASATVPTLAELREPLGEVFARFVPIQDESKQLADLLVARGYARIMSRPKILTSEDEPASIVVGNMGDPNVPTGRGMKMTVTAHVLHERNATRLTIDYLDRRPIGDLDDPNAPTSVSQIASTIVVPHEQYAALVAGSTHGPGQSVRLLLVSPQVHYPRPPDMGGYAGNPLPPTLFRGQRSRTGVMDADEPNETQVHMTFVFAKALIGATLDQETRFSVATLLAEEDPQGADDIAAPTRTVTLGEVLQKYVAQKLLPEATADALVDVLVSRGYMKVLAKPVVTVVDNREAQINIRSGDYYEPAAEPGSLPRRIEMGLSLV
ncbi:MAG: M56 family metallopeptidase [Sedimentisphaerales bacterium]|nr:M56 family metallopeptidase [Sedimentisphaerales bacterium]